MNPTRYVIFLLYLDVHSQSTQLAMTNPRRQGPSMPGMPPRPGMGLRQRSSLATMTLPPTMPTAVSMPSAQGMEEIELNARHSPGGPL